MYPQRQLAELANRKAVLQARIAVRRYETVATGARVARPFAFLDRVLAFWHNLSPVFKGVALPLGLLAWKKLRRREGKGTATASGALKAATIFETLPLILRGISAVRQVRAQHKVRSAQPRKAAVL